MKDKTVAKTNALRILDAMKISYLVHEYDEEVTDGESVAARLGQQRFQNARDHGKRPRTLRLRSARQLYPRFEKSRRVRRRETRGNDKTKRTFPSYRVRPRRLLPRRYEKEIYDRHQRRRSPFPHHLRQRRQARSPNRTFPALLRSATDALFGDII